MGLTDLVYKISAESSSFSKEMRRASKDVESFQKRAKAQISQVAKAFGTLGLAAATGLAAMVKQSIDAADELAKMSRRTGVATEDLSVLGFALEQSGSSLKAFETAARRLNQSIDQTADGTGLAARRFKQLGIDVKRSDGSVRSTIDVFSDLADRFKDLPDGATKSAIAIDVLGRSGTDLIPLLNGGSEGLEQFRIEAERLGLVIEQDTAEAAERFNDSLNRGRKILIGFANRVMPQVLSAFEAYTTTATDAGKSTEGITTAVDLVGSAFRALLLGVEGVRTGFVLTGESIALFFAVLVVEIEKQIGIFVPLLSGLGEAISAGARGQFGSIKGILRESARQAATAGEEGNRRLEAIARDGKKRLAQIIIDSNARIVAIEESKNKAIADADETALRRQALEDAKAEEEEKARKRADALKAQAKAAREAAAAQKAFVDSIDKRALAVTNSLRTAEDELRDGKAELNDLLLLGVISVKEYGKALDNLKSKYDPATISARAFSEQIQAEGDALTRSAEAYSLSLRTPLEAYQDSLAQYQRLLDAQVITQATFDLAVAQSTARLKEQAVEIENSVNVFKDFGEDAAGAVFDSFADLLFDPFDVKLDELLANFAKTIGRMALEVAKAEIISALFSGAAAGASGGLSPGLATLGANFADGGFVSGPGTGTSDSIPARLSNGEFVIPAAKTRELGVGWLYSLIKGKHKPGKTRFADGGLVSGGGGGATNIYNMIDIDELRDRLLASPAGERAVVNIIGRNKSKIRSTVNA